MKYKLYGYASDYIVAKNLRDARKKLPNASIIPASQWRCLSGTDDPQALGVYMWSMNAPECNEVMTEGSARVLILRLSRYTGCEVPYFYVQPIVYYQACYEHFTNTIFCDPKYITLGAVVHEFTHALLRGYTFLVGNTINSHGTGFVKLFTDLMVMLGSDRDQLEKSARRHGLTQS